MAGLEGLTIWERLQLGQATGWLTAMHAPLSEVLRKMEQGAARFPTRWVVHYALGDYYGKAGLFAEGLRACQTCMQLRPNDVRSAYALGSAYNGLTRAWVFGLSDEQRAQIELQSAQLGVQFHAEEALSALLDLGMTTLEAAREAIRWMKRADELASTGWEQQQIDRDIKGIRRRFPELG